jgi:hypothetical protein
MMKIREKQALERFVYLDIRNGDKDVGLRGLRGGGNHHGVEVEPERVGLRQGAEVVRHLCITIKGLKKG